MIEITISTLETKFFMTANANNTKTLYTTAAESIKNIFERTLPTEAKTFIFGTNTITMPRRYDVQVSTSTNSLGFKVNNITFKF